MSVIPILPTLIPGVFPPSRTTWEYATMAMKYFPVGTGILFFVPFFGMGKHSAKSKFNLPGKLAWVTMECPTLLVSAYIANTLPQQVGLSGLSDLPVTNKLLLGLYMLHYLNRAIITPIFLTPSIADIHIVNWASAAFFNVTNALSITGWLTAYGTIDNGEVFGTRIRMQVGLMIFFLGLFSNILHEDELREIRRNAKSEQEQKEKKAAEKGELRQGEKAERVYKIPQHLGFGWILYPHYLSEWIEWAGFWLIGGPNFVPAQNFLLAEAVPMAFQAYYGKKWYIEKFGKENVGNKKAVIPYIF